MIDLLTILLGLVQYLFVKLFDEIKNNNWFQFRCLILIGEYLKVGNIFGLKYQQIDCCQCNKLNSGFKLYKVGFKFIGLSFFTTLISVGFYKQLFRLQFVYKMT